MDTVGRLGSCCTSAVHDVMREMGYDRFVLPQNIRPLETDQRLCGRIWTFGGHPGRASPDDTYMQWTAMLAAAPAGHILVCQPRSSELAVMGELSAKALQMRGVLGYVADGGCRDVEVIRASSFPVFCTCRTPNDIVGRWLPDGLGEPISIGDVNLSTGDFLLADADGIVIVPPEHIEAVAVRAEKVMSTESDVRKTILAGVDAHTAYLKHRKF